MGKPEFQTKPPQAAAARPVVNFFELIPKTNFDFIGWAYAFYALSGLLVLATAAYLFTRGVPTGVEFRGGIVVQFQVPPSVQIDDIRGALAQAGLDHEVQSLGTPGQYLAKFKREEEEKDLDGRLGQVLSGLAPGQEHQILSKDFVGAVVGERLREQALFAIALSMLGMIVYVGFRFRNLIWGVAAVVAIIHDVFLSIGFLTFWGFEIDLVLVAALLTLAGYSVNDTVVIFDRLRERIRIYPRENLKDAINRAVNDTLSRTLLVAGAMFLSVLALALWGGMNLKPFSVTLLFGVVVGSYSTLGIAVNLVYTWAQWTGLRAR
ncbi:MAG: protein translocase subunit SecF [Elusimicrobia bacterium]|nr:protein translocase subunit SecF [Elusimicrobiota bacterium]